MLKTIAAFLLIIFPLFFALTGCHLASSVSPPPTHFHLPGGPGTTPPEFKQLTPWLDLEVILGIAVIAAAVFLFFFAPEQHRISVALAGGGATLAASSLFVRVSLWAIPWFFWGVIGVFALAAIVFALEFYAKIKAEKPATFADAVADVPSAIEQTIDGLAKSATSGAAAAVKT